MSVKIKDLHSLLIHELKDLYSAENQLVTGLPKMAKAAQDRGLQTAFKEHLAETKTHVKRLEEACAALDCKPGGMTCQGMKGLLEEGKDIISEDAPPDVKDAALIAAAQKVEHYEIAGYGTARAFAERLELSEVVDLLSQTLDEEKAADEKLTEIAVSGINQAAVSG